MNFDHVNKVSDYFRHKIYPHVTARVPINDFGQYLSKLSEHPNFKWMREELKAFPVNYFVDPEGFVKKYAKKCVAFVGSTSPQEGNMGIVYQISPSLHVFARMYNWIEKEELKSYLMLTVAFRDQAEYIKFFDDNIPLRLKGNTEDRVAGFAGFHTPSQTDDLAEFRKMLEEKDEEREEKTERGDNTP